MLISDVRIHYDIVQLDEQSQQVVLLDSSVLVDVNIQTIGSTRWRRPSDSGVEMLLSQ